jgi:hypothetical protein
MDVGNRRRKFDLMMDLFKLILGVMASLFKSRASLEAEILILRQQINVLRRRARNDRTSIIPIGFCLFGYHWFPSILSAVAIVCQAGEHHSLAPRWVSSVLVLAVAQPCWQTEDLG